MSSAQSSYEIYGHSPFAYVHDFHRISFGAAEGFYSCWKFRTENFTDKILKMRRLMFREQEASVCEWFWGQCDWARCALYVLVLFFSSVVPYMKCGIYWFCSGDVIWNILGPLYVQVFSVHGIEMDSEWNMKKVLVSLKYGSWCWKKGSTGTFTLGSTLAEFLGNIMIIHAFLVISRLI